MCRCVVEVVVVSMCGCVLFRALSEPVHCHIYSTYNFVRTYNPPVHPYTPLYTPAHPCTPLHTPTHSCTPLQTPVHPYTLLYTPAHPYTPLHTPTHPTHPYTPLYKIRYAIPTSCRDMTLLSSEGRVVRSLAINRSHRSDELELRLIHTDYGECR